MRKEKEPQTFYTVRLFFQPPSYQEARSTLMIRVFCQLCKINFNHCSVLEPFFQTMATMNVNDHPCPKCGAKHPHWEYYDSYERALVEFKCGTVITHEIKPSRFKCQSCGSTHAILPQVIIPFKSHSLPFVLAVLKDYFIGFLTVSQICGKYEIASSTLYAWKAAFLRDKAIWLGIAADFLISSEQFLSFLSSPGKGLSEFFSLANRSFLQTRSHFRRNGRFTPD